MINFPQSHVMSCNWPTRFQDVPRTPEAQTAREPGTPEIPETNMSGKTELSDFEQQRLANIAERDALLKKLTLESQSSGLFASPKNPRSNGVKPKKRAAPKVKTEEVITPRRTSSRLKGIAAESEVAKRKADDEYEAMREADRLKRMRRTDSFSQADMFISGQKLSPDSLIGVDVITKGVAKPYERTFGKDEIEKTTDKDLKALRKEMNGLKLWESWDPQRNHYTLHPQATILTHFRSLQGSRSPRSVCIAWSFTHPNPNLLYSRVTNWVIWACWMLRRKSLPRVKTTTRMTLIQIQS